MRPLAHNLFLFVGVVVIIGLDLVVEGLPLVLLVVLVVGILHELDFVGMRVLLQPDDLQGQLVDDLHFGLPPKHQQQHYYDGQPYGQEQHPDQWVLVLLCHVQDDCLELAAVHIEFEGVCADCIRFRLILVRAVDLVAA